MKHLHTSVRANIIIHKKTHVIYSPQNNLGVRFSSCKRKVSSKFNTGSATTHSPTLSHTALNTLANKAYAATNIRYQFRPHCEARFIEQVGVGVAVAYHLEISGYICVRSHESVPTYAYACESHTHTCFNRYRYTGYLL